MTTTTIKAKYNHGVIEPMEALDLEEGETIHVIVRKSKNREKQVMAHNHSRGDKKHYLERLAELQFESDVKDGSINHDKYIYDNPHCS